MEYPSTYLAECARELQRTAAVLRDESVALRRRAVEERRNARVVRDTIAESSRPLGALEKNHG